MRIPLEWLEQFIDLGKITTEKIAEIVSLRITEVEQILNLTQADIRVGEIKSVKVVPQANKLSQAKIDIGDQNISVIFSNNLISIKVGDRLPVAVAPTSFGKYKVIEKTFFNIKSQGMFCGDDELGLNLSDEGIMRFKKSVKPGTNVYKYLKFNDILDLKVTPNRSDLLSINGFARDLAVVLNQRFTPTIIPKLNIDNTQITNDLEIEVQAKDVVPRFSAIKISGIKNIQSPEWMQRRLIEAGFRPINAVVDITNYVMLELGQPLHAFDLEKISEIDTNRGQAKGVRKLFIRRAKNQETLITLDEKKQILPEGAIVIADQKKILDVAGIMGGQDSGVSEYTHEIVLVSSIIEASLIRKTSKTLKLATDASYRYERKLDPEITVSALKKAASLVLEICGGRITSKIFDLQAKKKEDKIKINFSLERFCRQTGSIFNINQAATIFRQLGLQISKKAKTTLEVQPPSWRHDLSLEEDLYEELLRISGYENLDQTFPTGPYSNPETNQEVALENEIALNLCNLQFNEVLNYSFYSEKEAKISSVSLSNHLKLTNPLGQDTSFLRASLIPGLLKVVEKNNSTDELISLFEIGHIFQLSDNQRQEIPCVAGIVLAKDLNFAIRLTRTAIEKIANLINQDIEIKLSNQNNAHILISKQFIGSFYHLDQNLVDFDKKKRQAVAFSVNINNLLKQSSLDKNFQNIPEFPSIIRDITLQIPLDHPVQDIINQIEGVEEILTQIKLKDIYTDKSDHKSITLRLTYQSKEKTLSDEKVNKVHDKILNIITKKGQVKIK